MIHATLGAGRAVRIVLTGFSLRNLACGIREAASGAVVALVILPLIIVDGFGGMAGLIAVLACACVLAIALGTILVAALDDPMARLRADAEMPPIIRRIF